MVTNNIAVTVLCYYCELSFSCFLQTFKLANINFHTWTNDKLILRVLNFEPFCALNYCWFACRYSFLWIYLFLFSFWLRALSSHSQQWSWCSKILCVTNGALVEIIYVQLPENASPFCFVCHIHRFAEAQSIHLCVHW